MKAVDKKGVVMCFLLFLFPFWKNLKCKLQARAPFSLVAGLELFPRRGETPNECLARVASQNY
jgi:hypothetical protein